MNNIPLPTTRKAQSARRNLITAAKAYQSKESSFTEVLYTFFSESQDDPVLQGLFQEMAFNFLNNHYDSLAWEKEHIEFVQQLLMLPLVNEEADPYLLCSTEEERIDRQIVIELNKAFPELLNDAHYLSLLDLSTCAHLCYSHLAHKANDIIKDISDKSAGYSSSSFLREAFNLIEKILKLHHPYARNVIAVSFLEGLTDKNKEKWLKLMQPLSKQVYVELEEYLENLFRRNP